MRLVSKLHRGAENTSVSENRINASQSPFAPKLSGEVDQFTASAKQIAGHKVGIHFTGAQRKIMTYNAENFYRTKSGKMLKNEQGVQALADVVLKEEPDVIALQEVGDKGLLNEFNKKYLKGAYPNVIIFDIPQLNGGIKVAILSKKDIRVVDSKSHWKAVCSEKGNQQCYHRDYLQATFETPTGYKFTVYNGHFKSMVGGEKQTMPKRMAEASGAAKILRAHLKQNPKANIIVAGDLNTIHDSQYGKPVLDRLSLADDDDPTNDFSEVMLKDKRDSPTYRGDGHYEPKKLDYMYLSPNMVGQLVKTYVSGKFTDAPWTKASDHHPLVSVIEEPDDVAGESKAKVKQPKKLNVVA